MGDVERSAQVPENIIGSTGAGTLGLILTAFIAFLISGAMLFDNLTERQTVTVKAPSREVRPPDEQAAAKLDSILSQQVEARRNLSELRELLLKHAAAPADPAVGVAPAVKVAPAVRVAPAATCPPLPARRDCRPALERIQRYLASIDQQAKTLHSATSPAGGESRIDYGTNLERLQATIAEARGYARQQLRLLAAAAAPVEAEELVVLAALVERVPAAGPPAEGLAWMKFYIVAGMFVILGLVFIVAVIAIFTTSNPAALTFATDTVKTMLGFFIGVITAFMGGPT
jgi:hypothetical protein